MSAGQMVEDVRLAMEGRARIDFYGRTGGVIPSPEEVAETPMIAATAEQTCR